MAPKEPKSLKQSKSPKSPKQPKEAKQRRVRHPSALTDNAQPGSATSMDVMLRWLTTPGNVKRWRTETRGPLCREIVKEIEAVGITYRDSQYVRYKVGAIEKNYIKAKQWLLETGMHDVFLSAKASKEVKAHVEHLCPAFRTLDPVFRGVPFAKKKKVEVVELDEDSTEGVEEDKEAASAESDKESDEESSESENEKTVQREEPVQKVAETQPKKKKFRDVLSTAAKVAMQALGEPPKKRGRPPKSAKDGTPTKRPASLTSTTPGEAKEKSSASARKTPEQEVAAGKDAEKQPAAATESEKQPIQQSGAAAAEEPEKPAATSNADKQNMRADTAKSTKNGADDDEELGNGDKQQAQEEAPERAASKPKKASKLSLAERRKAHDKDAAPVKVKRTAKDEKKPAKKEHGGKQKASVHKSTSPTSASGQEKQVAKQSKVGKQKPVNEEPTSVGSAPKGVQLSVTKQSKLGKRKSSSEERSSAKAATNGTQGTASSASKRKVHEEELASAKRARIEEEMDAERKFTREIERKALLKRVEDEEQQRQDLFAFERAKLKCELEAKQIHVLYEKATARKKLDQLGLSQEEIDCILPL